MNLEPNIEQAPASPQLDKARNKRLRRSDDVKERKASNPSNQGLLHTFARRTAAQLNVDAVNNNVTLPIEQEQGPKEGSRKRQKTSSPQPTMAIDQITPCTPESLVIQNQSDASKEAEEDAGKSEEPQNVANYRAWSLSPARPEPGRVQAVEMPECQHSINAILPITPKKQIKITKSGKLLPSPPRPNADTAQQASPKKRRGRPRKNTTQSTITIIRYGKDAASRSEFGAKIEAILNGPKPTSKQRTTPRKAAAKASKPLKNPHPFFTGKKDSKLDHAATTVTEHKPPTPKKSAVTPGKLRTEAMKERLQAPVSSFSMPLGPKKAANQSGLHEASWPTRDTAHFRDLRESDLPIVRSLHASHKFLRPSKLKRTALVVREEEDIISRLAKHISFSCKDDNRASCDFAPPEGVRLPERLLTTGSEIQRRVCEQIKAPVHRHDALVHPAVSELFADIEQILTPFDEGRCETQSWVQKYSPKSAAHVLQVGREASLLRDWLRNLTVMAVGGSSSSAQPNTPDIRKPPKRKRKRVEDVFIVSDGDDEDDEMVPLSSLVGTSPIASTSFCLPRWSRHKNVILISGPHGCGKSATIYAVAKELGFEIFEINSGTRRAGRDIQERVGDSTLR